MKFQEILKVTAFVILRGLVQLTDILLSVFTVMFVILTGWIWFPPIWLYFWVAESVKEYHKKERN